ncbi:hypothetical protein N431DRAFT_471892 [Stipitochalara longipes BDJ]|nr:hypothetical protein N431DRAFT_471892 [Stipitochalara longipes BDJ]
MPIIGLLAVGVSLAIDKYQERHAARNAETDSHDPRSGFSAGITSPETERRREEEAFNELQNYADFQKALSSKVLDELSRDDSHEAPYSPNFNAISNRSLGNQWYNPSDGARYTTQGQLPCPIIISQKDPGPDGPGWVRTYSPALMDCGIPQQSFLRFLDSFNESLQFFPDMEAVNIAAVESGIGWRDKSTNLSTAIPNAIQLAKNAQRGRELENLLDRANLSFFSPRGLFAMVITSNPKDLSPILTINVFEASTPHMSDPNTQDSNFNDMDYGQMTLNFSKVKQPRPRRSNKLQKMSNFISDYSDRKAHTQPTSPPNDLPIYSLISSISNGRESKKDSRKRRHHRFQHERPSSRASGVGSAEIPFGVTKIGKPPASVRGIMERMRRDDGGDNDSGQEKYVRDAEIQAGALYLVIVNDPGNDQKIFDHGELYHDPSFSIDPSLGKGKGKDNSWFMQDAGEESLPVKTTLEDPHFEEVDEDDLPPRYSSIHPQHRARVQAWREQNSESFDPTL